MEQAASAMHSMQSGIPCLKQCAIVARTYTEYTKEYSTNELRDEHVSCRYMYLSIDEAATHVGNKRFRLVAMVYEQNGQHIIGTTCSQPIRVMANNDVPTGAAHIRLSCKIRSSD